MSSENYTPTKLDKFVKGLLDVLFYVGIVLVILLPFVLPRFATSFSTLNDMNAYSGLDGAEYFNSIGNSKFFYTVYVPKLVSLMASGVLSIMILYELRDIMKTVVKGDCFVRSNVIALRRIGSFAFIITLVMFANVFILFSLTALVVALVFFIGGLFSKVLSRVFDRAVSYKEENDLTI